MLNGFPAVNHGVSGCRRVVESVNVPVQVRHGTPTPRLLTEIAYAGGFTSYEGGGISYNLPYCKNVPMETTIANWQYVDRLTGLYEEMGVSINREPYGPLTGTLVPPCISHAVAIIEALLAAEQGVKNITVGYGQCGNLIQDIAAVRTLEELTEEYLCKVRLSRRSCYDGAAPVDGRLPGGRGKGVRRHLDRRADRGAFQGHEGHRQKPARGHRHPDDGGERAGAALHTAGRQHDDRADVCQHASGRGNGDHPAGNALHRRQVLRAWHGRYRARRVPRRKKAGVLDVPFAPCRFNAGQMLPCRDNDGAVRIMNMGNLPFTKELRDYHMGKIAERAAFEHRKATFQMVTDDVYAISKGRLVGRPR